MSRGKQNKMANCLGQEWAAKQTLQSLNMALWFSTGDNKGLFVRVSLGFLETSSHFSWILSNKAARILKLLTAGICSNPNFLGNSPRKGKAGWENVLIQFQAAFPLRMPLVALPQESHTMSAQISSPALEEHWIGGCAHCSGTWALPEQRARGLPAGITSCCCSVPQPLITSGICRRSKTGFSAQWEWNQFLSCSSEQLQKWFPNPGNTSRDLIPL